MQVGLDNSPIVYPPTIDDLEPVKKDMIVDIPRSNQEPLLRQKSPYFDFDLGGEPEEGAEKTSRTNWGKWAGRIGWAAGAAGMVGMRCSNISPFFNGLASFGIGFCAQASAEWGFKGKGLVQMQKSLLPVLGQVSLFFASQLYDNTEDKDAQKVAVQFIICLLGANLEGFIHRFIDRGAVRVETHEFSHLEGERFEKLFSKPIYLQALKVTLAAAALAGHFVLNDSVMRALSLFVSCYYAAQAVLGENIAEYIDRKIAQKDSVPTDDNPEGTRYRTLKTFLSTAGWVIIPALFIPWNADPHTPERIAQLPFIGAIAGIFDGISERFFENRLEKVPIRNLDELQILNLPGSTEYKTTGVRPWRYIYFKVYRVAFPIIAMMGLTAFLIWQEVVVLKDQNSKSALGSMYAGFGGGLAAFNIIDWTWDPDKRNIIRDKLMTSLNLKNRFLGMNPIYYYLAIQNAISLSSDKISERENNPVYTVMPIVGWAFYGWTMAFELMRTNWRRKGTIDQNAMMVLINAAMTAKLSMTNALHGA